MWPRRRQPTRLPHPWDSPGKNTGVGCHFLLQCMKVKSESEVAQSCPTLTDPMDCSPPGSSVHGILQARVLEWVAIAFSEIIIRWYNNVTCVYIYSLLSFFTKLICYLILVILSMGFPGALVVKSLSAMQETQVWSLGWEDPLEQGLATHSSILPWRILMDRRAWWASIHGAAKELDTT